MYGMYGIYLYTYIYHKHHLNVGKYTIRRSYGEPSFRPSVFLKYVQLFVRKVFQGMFGEHRISGFGCRGFVWNSGWLMWRPEWCLSYETEDKQFPSILPSLGWQIQNSPETWLVRMSMFNLLFHVPSFYVNWQGVYLYRKVNRTDATPAGFQPSFHSFHHLFGKTWSHTINGGNLGILRQKSLGMRH